MREIVVINSSKRHWWADVWLTYGGSRPMFQPNWRDEMRKVSILLLVVMLALPAIGSINDDGTPGGNPCQPVMVSMFWGVLDYSDGSAVNIWGYDMMDPCTGETWTQPTGYQVWCGDLNPCMAAVFVPTW